MEKLKNCPNCGGILDDEGRCLYCKSKVYDLTGINIDFNTGDIVLLKINWQGQTVYLKGFPVNATLKMNPINANIPNGNVSLYSKYNNLYETCDLEFHIMESDVQNDSNRY